MKLVDAFREYRDSHTKGTGPMPSPEQVYRAGAADALKLLRDTGGGLEGWSERDPRRQAMCDALMNEATAEFPVDRADGTAEAGQVKEETPGMPENKEPRKGKGPAKNQTLP